MVQPFATITITKTSLQDPERVPVIILQISIFENASVTFKDETQQFLIPMVQLTNEQFSNIMYLVEQVQETTWDSIVGRKDLEIIVERKMDAAGVYRIVMIQAVLDYLLPIIAAQDATIVKQKLKLFE